MLEEILKADTAILQLIQDHIRNSFLDPFFVFITRLGDYGFIWIIIILLLFALKYYRPYSLLLAFNLAGSYIIGDGILKSIFARIRPFYHNDTISLLIHGPSGYSFPSGHTMYAFSCAAILFYINKKWGIAAYILAILIAFSRMYLYVHYPTDILGGILFGTVTALLSISLYKRYYLKPE